MTDDAEKRLQELEREVLTQHSAKLAAQRTQLAAQRAKEQAAQETRLAAKEQVRKPATPAPEKKTAARDWTWSGIKKKLIIYASIVVVGIVVFGILKWFIQLAILAVAAIVLMKFFVFKGKKE